MKSLRFTLILITLACINQIAPAQDADYYSIMEHGPGRWMSFSTPISVQQNLTLKGLLNYSLVFNPDFEIRTNSEGATTVFYLFRFEEIGEFDPVYRPQLPTNTHIQFIMDGSPSPEFSVRKISFRNERDVRHVIKFAVVIPKNYIEKIVNSRTVRGLLYFRTSEGEKSDVKTFTFDAKTLRTLDRLYSVAK